ncbi:peptide-methionine (R)-S-oxide reductase [Entomomonas moraniae]|uniref:Peptide methionine sulfoxide reductase MsrB n=1 Tax=Entomomonas moraniae TaxID=2213226 RepID=A0A3S9XFC5_9GAMM|nr:peptide-methionine (R)-S-oxide reductase MsrB [Entomomonas moraniae]AZS51142.1 peptide-methionine (R)-S-oxide reductase [Entomomonas moraniae]
MSEKAKTLEEWQQQLTPDQFYVCRLKGTEHPFSGKYYKVPDVAGIYHCVCCGAELFETSTQFEAGCGWPSFYQPIKANAVEEHEDNSHNMHRVEVVCAQCKAHLGHVFPDGPPPTGLRYCINSIAINFQEK